MTIKELKITQLHPYENNPRNNESAVEAVAASIQQFGFKVPIVIDADNVIIAGHTRLKAAQQLGLETVPCIVADDLTPEQVKAFRVADNKTAELAEWDFELLESELAEIEMDMAQFGFEAFAQEAETEIFEDEVPEVDEESEPVAKLGDIWKLGRHRLMCGDSTSVDDIEKLMNGEKADLMLTDPPYGINAVNINTKQVGGGGETHFGKVGFGEAGKNKWVDAKTYREIKGDDTTETAKANYNIISQISDNQIIFGGNYFTDFLPPKACWVVWDKQNTGNFADVELAWTSFNKGAKLYKWLWNGLCRKGDRETEGKTRVHPTQKPVGLMAEILNDFSNENDIIIDCFGGSGSTLIACEQTNRNCLMMEYEAHYVDVIIKRWETLTGEKAVLVEK